MIVQMIVQMIVMTTVMIMSPSGQETSKTLDYLLSESGYNRRVRPDSGRQPVQVNVNLAIR